ncbi:L-cysteate sulfo-lyase [Thalassocella blandensis]|nr:L-cysteate sulfo-lyase [Thalassocella blandensis]
MLEARQRLLPDNWLLKDLDVIASLAPMEPIDLPVFHQKDIQVSIKRDDLLDPQLGGNKIYKLHAYLQAAVDAPDKPIISFGGAYSNHIYALAAAGAQLKLPTVGIIRGEEPQQLSPTLQDAKRFGMQLHFVSREEYQQKNSQEFREKLQRKYGDHHLIPEGGAGPQGVAGCAALARGILNSVDDKPDLIVHACGTGASVAGLITGLALSPATGVHVMGVSVLKGYPALEQEIEGFLDQMQVSAGSWELQQEFHCGGYAKYPDYLADFVSDFEKQTQICLDPVYTSKVMWALVKLAEQDAFTPGTRIIAVHSGGLQGCRGVD